MTRRNKPNLTEKNNVLYFEDSAQVAGSASVAQLVEHRFRKPEVKGSSPFAGSIKSIVYGYHDGSLYYLGHNEGHIEKEKPLLEAPSAIMGYCLARTFW